MKIEYQGKKWGKEIIKFQKFKKSVKGRFDNNENFVIKQFQETNNKDFLRLYNHLSGVYERMSTYYYLDDINSDKIINYTYLSGMAMLISACLHKNGARTQFDEVVKNSIEQNTDYALFQLIAVAEMELPYVSLEENNLIMLMYHQKYEQAKLLLEKIPDNPDESYEIYYINPENLQNIYMAIIEHDEKRFNEELVRRIKKYRKNMVGYSTIIDIVSVALIKIAEREGLHCMIDVIEIPKQFFDKTCAIDKKEVKLPYYDEFLKEYECL